MGNYNAVPKEMVDDYSMSRKYDIAFREKLSEAMGNKVDQEMKRIEMSPQYPTIIHLNAVEPKDGDTLILSSHRVMSPQEVQNIRDDFEHCLPNIKVIIVSGYGVDVMRSGQTEGSRQ